jgi:hypothetical protein
LVALLLRIKHFLPTINPFSDLKRLEANMLFTLIIITDTYYQLPPDGLKAKRPQLTAASPFLPLKTTTVQWSFDAMFFFMEGGASMARKHKDERRNDEKFPYLRNLFRLHLTLVLFHYRAY